ncbi:thioesterase II family protein [Chitinimonas lacunae]|uniref:Thioesterase II family protein n=1 Tax=Chitinimonas lacunae TaxID=1963018 RepID=A0ABV8MM95_9NEIS
MSDWLYPLPALGRPGPDAPVLVCFPPAGGNPYFFGPLARVAADAARVQVAALPGRPPRMAEPAGEDFWQLVSQLSEALAGLDSLDKALFFGHSMGAVLAYHCCVALQRQGKAPAGLVLSGAQAPTPFFARMRQVACREPAQMIAELRRMGGVEPALLELPEFEELFLGAYRADCRAAAAYHETEVPLLDLPLLLLAGQDDELAPPAALAGWRSVTRGPTRLLSLPGGHFYLNEQWPRIWDTLGATFPWLAQQAAPDPADRQGGSKQWNLKKWYWTATTP